MRIQVDLSPDLANIKDVFLNWFYEKAPITYPEISQISDHRGIVTTMA
jgi:hypothetical protein